MNSIRGAILGVEWSRLSCTDFVIDPRVHLYWRADCAVLLHRNRVRGITLANFFGAVIVFCHFASICHVASFCVELVVCGAIGGGFEEAVGCWRSNFPMFFAIF